MPEPKLGAADRLRQLARRGSVATSGAPNLDPDDMPPAESQAAAEPEVVSNPRGATAPRDEFLDDALPPSPPPAKTPMIRPGTFSKPVGPAPAPISAQERLRALSSVEEDSAKSRKSMAAMRVLTRLLESVYSKPGSSAAEEERIEALKNLVQQADNVGQSLAKLYAPDQSASGYVKAMAMEAVVGLVGKAWERGDAIDWGSLIVRAGADPTLLRASEEMAHLHYKRVQDPQDMYERIGISLHSAYWNVYTLGADVDGITPEIAQAIVADGAAYLSSRPRSIADNDLYTSWLQGAIKRFHDLVCAELRAQHAGGEAPTQKEIAAALEVAKAGFEGVEIYAQHFLSAPRSTAPEPVPTER